MNKKFKDITLNTESMAIVNQANVIINQYQAEGYTLTLRQLYYQFVGLDLIPNNQKSYNRIGRIVQKARLGGLMDWEAIEDRTRNLRSPSTWNDPSRIIKSAYHQFKIDKWSSQEYRPEVWVEKEAMAGIVSQACDMWGVPWFCCRGYVSDSEMYNAGVRAFTYQEQGHGYGLIEDAYGNELKQQTLYIIHLGDHDPSGIDMTRDIKDKIELFSDGSIFHIERVALNYEQVQGYNLPPNPAKLTDTRSTGYIEKYGPDSWELDALKPSAITELIQSEIVKLIDKKSWDKATKKEDYYKGILWDFYQNNKEMKNYE